MKFTTLLVIMLVVGFIGLMVGLFLGRLMQWWAVFYHRVLFKPKMLALYQVVPENKAEPSAADKPDKTPSADKPIS